MAPAWWSGRIGRDLPSLTLGSVLEGIGIPTEELELGLEFAPLLPLRGHASAAMTLDAHAELFDDDLEANSTALDQARSAAVVADTLPRADPSTASMP